MLNPMFPPKLPRLILLCFLVLPVVASAQISDDFSDLELDPATWTLIDPVGDGTGEIQNGRFTLNLPAGSGHDPRVSPNRTLRLNQNVPDGDFEIEAKFLSTPTKDYQVQGLMVEAGSTSYLRLEYLSDGQGLFVSCATNTGGINRSQGGISVTPDGALWLRLSRTGNTWRGFFSLDGAAWTEVFVFDHVMAVVSVGVFGGNAGSGYEDTDRDVNDPPQEKRIVGRPAPAFDVMVDYFFDAANPIDPEDGNLRNAVRAVDGLQAIYHFNEGAGNVVFDHAPTEPRLDLVIGDMQTISWLPGGGLDLNTATLISSPGPAEKINAACGASDEITMEMWVDPETWDQEGPARVFTVSEDPGNRNASLSHGQYGFYPNTVYGMRMRTTETTDNGTPGINTPVGSLTGDLQHVVYTRDTAGNARIYLDGQESVAAVTGGTQDNWDSSYRIGVGAEMDGSRFWLGTIHLAAVYDRALAPLDIADNFAAGPEGGIPPESDPVIALIGISPGDEFSFHDSIDLAAVAVDLDGEIVSVEFFAGDVSLGVDTEASFTFTWSDPTVGNHLIHAVATDDQGNTATSASIPVLVTVPTSFRSAQFVSDDFHDADLDEPWIVTDGTTGATVSQSGGHVRIDLPGVTQDPWDTGAETVFVGQPEIDTDFALEFKLAAADFQGDSFGGFRCEGTGAEVVQLLGEMAGSAWTVSWGSALSVAVPEVTEALWLQVRRQADSWTFLYSVDGIIWQQAANLTMALTPTSCGWVAGGIDSVSGPQLVAFDYAFNLASPIIPEDGGSGGDVTPPVISNLTVTAYLDHVELAWQTDEPAFSRVAYGLTPAYELGLWQGTGYLADHQVDITGLTPGEHYHFKVTCIDPAGNISHSGDQMMHTDLEADLSAGPGEGDVYRETTRAIYQSNEWRVTDPDAENSGAAQFLPNPVLSLEVPDLTGAVRAEMIIDRWGGHPGTSNKRIRLAGRSWLHLPELAAIPAYNPECYMYEDNLSLDIPLDQLAAGTITLEGTADDQICHSFNWGQWGWYGVVMRVYFDGSVAHPTGSIMSPAAGDTIIDAVDISVDATATGTVEEVQVLAYYEGVDIDGDGVFTEWHREYFRVPSATTISIDGIVGTATAAPYDLNWDVSWIPDQVPGSVKLQARILDDKGMWYVTDFVEDLSLRHSDGVMKMYTMDNVPSSFWVRSDQVKTAEFTIPPADDLTFATSARMVVPTWNASDAGVIDINGQWQTSGFGISHFYSLDQFALFISDLNQGLNEITITAPTGGHGMEVLWPGPMFLIRYGPEVVQEQTKESDLTGVPVRFALGDNYPNPFNPVTRISFDLPVASGVQLRIHDVRGSLVRTLVAEGMPVGFHSVIWDGTDDLGGAVSSGVYFYRITAEGFADTRKMMLLK